MLADSADKSAMGQSHWRAAAIVSLTRNDASALGERAKMRKVSADSDGIGQNRRCAEAGAEPITLSYTKSTDARATVSCAHALTDTFPKKLFLETQKVAGKNARAF